VRPCRAVVLVLRGMGDRTSGSLIAVTLEPVTDSEFLYSPMTFTITRLSRWPSNSA